ncbi:carboxyl-terminal processing protease CtpZ [Cyanobium sp. NIES-981]|uniref:carboxyl-terminal processing protease CtpZ n=1 Tax=Cyanobium sp. NIES-981 TaxID=1851505 RepID=UPI0007DDABD4|nr:Carboxyl-terminal-processing protease [Cyanobium sp. NIES-981]
MSTERPWLRPSPLPCRPRWASALRAALALGVVLLLAAAPVRALSDAQQLVVEAWRLVNQSYVDPQRFEAVHWRRLRQKALERPISSSDDAYTAIEAMLAPIGDPYTRLLRPDDYANLRSSTQGSVNGVGLQIGLRDGDQRVVVIAPLDDSPAAEAGLTSGTELLAVDGEPTPALGLEGTAAALRGSTGSQVLVTVARSGQPEEVVLERRQVNLRPVRSRRLRLEGHTVGYLRITQFAEPVPEQVHQALTDLVDQGIEGLLLDLRNNSGGLVSAGLAVADQLLDRQPIVETQDRDGLSSPVQAGAGQLYDGPMLTLVNGGTASASEILAGALQDNGRSALAGSRTFGKGLIQSLLPLSDSSGLAVTVARYVTPSGRDIQNQGIEPDHPLPAPEPLNPGGDNDAWLQEASDLLLEQIGASDGP